jgi:ketosteroid isomerase-like protein
MPQEKPVRIPLEAQLSASQRTLDERLIVRFPALLPVVLRFVQRLPLRSGLRRRFLARAIPRGYAATTRGDFELALAAYHPDVEMHVRDSAGVSADLVGVHRGHDGWRHIVQEVLDVWEFKWQPEEVLDCGRQAVITLRLETRGRGSGVPMTHRVFDVFTWRDGLVVRHEILGDQEEAFEAVGLSE